MIQNPMIYFMGPWFWTEQLGWRTMWPISRQATRLLSVASRVGTQSRVEKDPAGCHIRLPKASFSLSYHIPKLFLQATSRFIRTQHSTAFLQSFFLQKDDTEKRNHVGISYFATSLHWRKRAE